MIVSKKPWKFSCFLFFETVLPFSLKCLLRHKHYPVSTEKSLETSTSVFVRFIHRMAWCMASALWCVSLRLMVTCNLEIWNERRNYSRGLNYIKVYVIIGLYLAVRRPVGLFLCLLKSFWVVSTLDTFRIINFRFGVYQMLV